MGAGDGVVAEGEEVGEVLVVREEVRLDFGLDLERVGVEALDEEAEIRCGQRRGGVTEVLRRQELSDVDRVEQGVHFGAGWRVWEECGFAVEEVLGGV